MQSASGDNWVYVCGRPFYLQRRRQLIYERNVTSDNPPASKSICKNPLLYSSLLIVVIAGYVGWILYSRYHANRTFDQRAQQEQAKKQREADRVALDQLGGNKLAIEMLYAPPQIPKGETAQICFGVANAKSVTLAPQDNPVWPSHNLCIDIKPVKTTTYTLTATGADGRSISRQVTVEVR